MAIFLGSAAALVTPFAKNKIDFEALGNLIEFQISSGCGAVVVLGTTGEPSVMTQEEKQAVIDFAVAKVANRVPLIAGTGSNCTATAVESSRAAQRAGANAVLAVTPYYNKCTQKGLIDYYTQIADSVSIPVIAYNVPSRTGVNLLPATALALSSHKNIAAIKEASGNIDQISETMRLCQGRLDIYSGDDGIILPMLALGAAGVISVAANIIPDQIAKLCKSFFEGDLNSAKDIQFKIAPLIKALFAEVNPGPVKAALALMEKCSGELRPPLFAPEPPTLELLKKELRALNLIA